MIRSLTESVGETIAEGVGRVVGLAQEHEALRADLLESEDAYLIVFDAPGAEPADVQVRYEDGAVHARVDRFRAYHEGFDMRFPGRGLSLEGSKRLPPDAVVDADAATATLRTNGTLQIELPKIESTVEADGAPADGGGDDGIEGDDLETDDTDT